jgi:hypothetical protein
VFFGVLIKYLISQVEFVSRYLSPAGTLRIPANFFIKVKNATEKTTPFLTLFL